MILQNLQPDLTQSIGITKNAIVAILLFFVIGGLSGCISLNRKVVLHPIEKSDIFRIQKNARVEINRNETVYAEKDGWFLSDYYVEQVMKAKIGE